MALRLFVLAILTAVWLPAPAMAADSGWMRLSQANAYLKKLKRDDELPVSIDCRNDSKVAAQWKPSVRIVSKPNTAGKSWHVIAKVEFRDWQPGNLRDKNRPKWRVVSRKVVQGGGGGTKFFCTIWHV